MRRFSNNLLFVAAIASIAIILSLFASVQQSFVEAQAAPVIPGVSKQRFPLKSEIDFNNLLKVFNQNAASTKQIIWDIGNAFAQAGLTYPKANQGIAEADIINNTAPFIRQMYSIFSATQSSLNLQYAYVATQVNGGPHWTDVGVKLNGVNGGYGSYYTNSSGFWKQFPGANINTTASVTGNSWTDAELYTQSIKSLTKADSKGKLFLPYFYFDPNVNKSFDLITFAVPIRFNANGNCIAAAAIDFPLDVLQGVLVTNGPVFSEGIVLEASSNSWKFVTGNIQNAFTDTGIIDYVATATPNARVNSFASDVQTKLGTNYLAAGASDLTSNSWSNNGFNYQAVSIYPYLFVTRTPQTLIGSQAAGGFMSTIGKSCSTAARAVKTFLTSQAGALINPSAPWAVLDNSDDFTKSQKLFNALGNMALGSVGAFKYIYLSYALPGNSGQWGDLGVEHATPTIGAMPVFYSMATAANGTRYDWTNTNASTLMSHPNTTTEMETYTQFIVNMSTSTGGTAWQPPVSWVDDVTGSDTRIVTYTQCLSYNASNNCVVAISIDLDVDWILNATRDHVAQEYSNKGSVISVYWGPTGQFMFDTLSDGIAWKNNFPFFNMTPSAAINTQNNFINAQIKTSGKMIGSDMSITCDNTKCASQSVVNVNLQFDYATFPNDPILIIVETVPVSSITVNPNYKTSTPGYPVMIQALRNMRSATVITQFATDMLNNMVNGFYNGLEVPCYQAYNSGSTNWGNAAAGFLAMVNTLVSPNGNGVALPLAGIRIMYNLTGTSGSTSVGLCGCYVTKGTNGNVCYYTDSDNTYLRSQSGSNTVTQNFPYTWNGASSNSAIYPLMQWTKTDYWNVTNVAHPNSVWTPLRTFTDAWGATRQFITSVHGDWIHRWTNPNNFMQGGAVAVDWDMTFYDSSKKQDLSTFRYLFGSTSAIMQGPYDVFVTDLATQTFIGITPATTIFNSSDSTTFKTVKTQATPFDRVNVLAAIVAGDITSVYNTMMQEQQGGAHTQETIFDDKTFYTEDGFNYYIEFCWNFAIVARVATVHNSYQAASRLAVENLRSVIVSTTSQTLSSLIKAIPAQNGKLPYWDRTNAGTRELVKGMASILLAFKSVFIYNWASYAIYDDSNGLYPSTSFTNKNAIWGDIGCEYLAAVNSQGSWVNCLLVNATGYRLDFFGSDISGTPYSITNFVGSPAWNYGALAISNWTSTQGSSLWFPPSSYTDPVDQRTSNAATYTNCAQYGGYSTLCIAAFSVDIAAAQFTNALDAAIAKDTAGGYLEYLVLGWHPKNLVTPLVLAASDLQTAQTADKGQKFIDFTAKINAPYAYTANWTMSVAVYDTTLGHFISLPIATNWVIGEDIYVGSQALNPNYNGLSISPASSGLSVGAIIGIVIGVLVFLAIVGVVAKKKAGGSGGAATDNKQFQYNNMQTELGAPQV
jgi:hypothetical protein